MRKIIEIYFSDPNTHPNKLICVFDNGEIRLLDLNSILKDKHAKKILSKEDVFKSARVGEWGEVYWPGMAEIVGLNGEKEACNYDISPEFAYAHSEPLEKRFHPPKHKSFSD